METSVDFTSPRKAAMAFIFAIVLLDVIALGIVIPVLPKLIETMLGGDTPRAAEVFGIFGTAWALMQFTFSPVLGALSDRFGRRPVLLISMSGHGLDYVLMALAPSLGWLFLGRIISGITASSFSTAYAYIADVTPPEKRAGAFGMVGAAFGIGFVLGPALGGLLGALDPRLPFWVAAAFSLANAAYGWFVLPESLTSEHRMAFSWAHANPVGSLRLFSRHPQLIGLAGVAFLYQLAHVVLPSVTVLYTSYRYGWSNATMGLTLAAVGVASGIVQAALIRPTVDRFGERTALIVRRRGLHHLWPRHHQRRLLERHSRDGAVGAGRRGLHGPHEPPGGRVRAGPIARCQREHHGAGGPFRAGPFHAGLRPLNRAGRGLAPARSAIPPRRRAVAGRGRAGLARDAQVWGRLSK